MEKYFRNVFIHENITKVKLDIGLSHNAPCSQPWLKRDPNLLVIGFEPNPDSIINYVEPSNIEYINTRFFLFPIALSNVPEPTEMMFYKTDVDPGTSSLHKPTHALGYSYRIEERVPVYSLKHFFDLFPFDKFEYIEYIKIDAQGSDLDILIGAGDYLKERVVYVTAEAEAEKKQYENTEHNSSENIENYMLSQNFIRVYNKCTLDPTFLNKKFQHLEDKIHIEQQS